MMDSIAAAMQHMRPIADIANFRPDFENQDIIDRVRRSLRERTLTLALGAGVSNSVSLANWDDIVLALTAEIYGKIDPALAEPMIAAIRKYGYGNPTIIRHLETIIRYQSELRRMLRERLYGTLDENKVAVLVAPICDTFLVSGCKSQVNHIISYNFDNVIERYLKREGQTNVCSIYSNETYPISDGGPRIYHPHGFLPHSEDDLDDSFLETGIVFSEIDYHSQSIDLGHWSNILQLHHFMNRTCLFVGLSMTDPNVRRLLDYANHKTKSAKRHVAIQRSKGNPLTDYFIEQDLSSLGMSVLWVRNREDFSRVLLECANL